MQQKSKSFAEYHDLKKKIKDIYVYLKKANKQLPSFSTYAKGNIETLKENLKHLEVIQKDYEIDRLKNRIGILYNRYKKFGGPLPESLEYYTENKSINELRQIESELDKDLGNIDIERVHQKLVKEIEAVVSALAKAGDTEPTDNYSKYAGTTDNEFSNDILRHNLKTLEERLKALHDKQAQPQPSSSTKEESTKKWIPKPEAKPSSSTTPKPEAKKSTGKKNRKMMMRS